MLAISPQRDSNGNEREAEVGRCLASPEEFCNKFMGGEFLEDINFDDLFAGLDDGDMLPDLEVDPVEILAAFSVPYEEDSGTAAAAVEASGGDGRENPLLVDEKGLSQAEEVLSAREKADDLVATASANLSFSEADRGPKTSAKGSKGKRKVKKYRAHRKHLLAREVETARWSQRWHMNTGGGGDDGDGTKRNINPWLLPIMGFSPPPVQPLKPLHVWGHPTVDQSRVLHLWPKHLAPAPSLPSRPWSPQPSLPPPSFCHTHYSRGPGDGWVPSALTQGTPCFPQPLLTARFPAPLVLGIPPRPLYRSENVVPPTTKLSSSLLSLDAHPSMESIDAAIGDVLAKPWLPLRLGLKPPSLEGVQLVESQRRGLAKIPSACG
uniref:Probable transcription factor GLK1 isoform X2 n=1 Tax=Elaeis guineensis var. tenera TaxID=51953 RepID=A0A6I9R2N5_ELAGV|nr:probable transcription factor GLK1 isoform X2 [Elaeis guineensis]